MPIEAIHGASGYLALTFLGIVIATGICISISKILKTPEGALLFKAHKLASGLFITALLPHIATTKIVNGYFTLGSFLMGLTLTIAFSFQWFPDKKKLLLGLKGLIFLLGSIVLLVAHLKV